MATTTSRGTIKVVLEGRGPVTLHPSTDHVATGGEGSIYHVSDLAVKLYLDPDKMMKLGVPAKVKQLAKILKHPYIVAPLGLAVSPTGDPIGHYLPFLEPPPVSHPLAQVFTSSFYQQEGFTKERASKLVDRMRETVNYAHGVNTLLIDPNELNWFAQNVQHDPEPRVIDVDSWVIDGQMPATVALMPSIRDWHTKLGKDSDWFSWAIVTFQIYTGIHPYKGTLDGYGRTDMEARMKANASVFSTGVRLNRAVREFSSIPGPLLSWYEATFQKGERCQPPSPYDTGVTTPRAALTLRVVTKGDKTLILEKLLGYATDPVIRTFSCGVALLASGKLVDIGTKKNIYTTSSPLCEVVSTDHGWLIGTIVKGETVFVYVDDSAPIPSALQFKTGARQLVAYENRMFAVGVAGLTEIKTTFFGDKCIASAKQTWNASLNSTKWYSGVGVLDALGAKFVIAPNGAGAVAQIRVRELDGVPVIAGKAGNRFASFITLDRQGVYHKVELTFDKDYTSYKAWTGVCDSSELNLAILPKGVAATILQDGELVIFVPTNGNVTKIQDGQIATDMLLANWGDRVIYTQAGEVWTVRMK